MSSNKTHFMSLHWILIVFVCLDGLTILSLAEEPVIQEIGIISITPQKDTRQPWMIQFDNNLDRGLMESVNNTKYLSKPLKWIEGPISLLRTHPAPFAILHTDLTVKLDFTQEEKDCMEEYIKRGGFIMLLNDFYQQTSYYSQEFLYELYDRSDVTANWFFWGLADKQKDFMHRKECSFFREYHRVSVGDVIKPKETDPLLKTSVLFYKRRPVACRWIILGGGGGRLAGNTVFLNIYINAIIGNKLEETKPEKDPLKPAVPVPAGTG